MSGLPLRARLKEYRGGKRDLMDRAMEENRKRERIVDYVNRLIANDPAEMQQHLFSNIAFETGYSVDLVREAIPIGGHNGFTIRVTWADRERLEPFRDVEFVRSPRRG